LFATEVVLGLCGIWRIPVLYYLQDCYPEALEHTGHIKVDGSVARLLRRWDGKICHRSSGVVVVSDGMKALICRSRGIPEAKVSVQQNWIDKRYFDLLPNDNRWRRDAGISQEKFVVMYAGTLGYVSGAQVLVEVARRLTNRPEVTLVCIGEGVLKANMQTAAAGAGLSNIIFMPVQPIERVAEMHAAADVTILTTQVDYPDASIPSKLISYLAAGRPVVCAAHHASTVAKIVRNANAGIIVEAGAVESVAAAISFLLDDPAEVQQMGENARRCFEEQFTFEPAYDNLKALINQVGGGRSPSRG
jgi:colanic acid biosynthesis glycosyl transferase WcaI